LAENDEFGGTKHQLVRRSLLRLPGTIVVEILDPIAPGLDKMTFSNQLEDAIEGATNRLIQEAVRNDQASGAAS